MRRQNGKLYPLHDATLADGKDKASWIDCILLCLDLNAYDFSLSGIAAGASTNFPGIRVPTDEVKGLDRELMEHVFHQATVAGGAGNADFSNGMAFYFKTPPFERIKLIEHATFCEEAVGTNILRSTKATDFATKGKYFNFLATLSRKV